jgi:hypothetical protein
MKILVIEPDDNRRADLADAICELPGVEVLATVAAIEDGHAVIAREPVDVIVAGELSAPELTTLDGLARTFACTVILVSTLASLAAALHKRASRRVAPHTAWAVLERQTDGAPRTKLAGETVDLSEWLPRTIMQLRRMVPDYIELVPIVAADTPAVHCVPAILEQVVFELVLQACTALPWGGTVWLTAGPGDDGEVKLDVLENGLGEIQDLTLRASAVGS